MGNNDWLYLFGIALIVFAFMSPIIVDELTPDIPKSDYEVCINKCPCDFNGKFKDLECLKMCKELIDCKNKT